MKQIKWFDRSFDFSSQQTVFPSIIERLEGTPLRLGSKVRPILSEHLTIKTEGQWSIKENIGHLMDLEPLWQGRLDDILENKEYLRPTDLTNQKTDEAQHNQTSVTQLIDQFTELRTLTLAKLHALNEADMRKTALHPRLEAPMRIIDLFLFVAEHDDHHLATITAIKSQCEEI